MCGVKRLAAALEDSKKQLSMMAEKTNRQGESIMKLRQLLSEKEGQIVELSGGVSGGVHAAEFARAQQEREEAREQLKHLRRGHDKLVSDLRDKMAALRAEETKAQELEQNEVLQSSLITTVLVLCSLS